MNKTYEFTAPCHFGLEAVLKREITDLGYDVASTDNGRVSFSGDAEALVRANVWLRTAERVLLNVGEFQAVTFDELFEETAALPWEEFLPRDARFWVTKATSVNSKLFSTSDIQSIMKKAMVRRLGAHYGQEHFEETGAAYPVRVFVHNDTVSVGIDTSGASLHKRGYRTETVKAPITETLAAALILLTPWHKDRILVDPFCGSGTFPIEAAMMAAHMAPGMNREFTSQLWDNLVPRKCWYEVLDEARDLLDLQVETDIQGYDADPAVIRMAMKNAEQAGVAGLIHFQQRPVSELSHAKKYGFLITNPPYGERLMSGETEEVEALYRTLGERFRALDDWSLYLITGFPGAERAIGRKADKKRKVYNGMMRTWFYTFAGQKPPKRHRALPEEEAGNPAARNGKAGDPAPRSVGAGNQAPRNGKAGDPAPRDSRAGRRAVPGGKAGGRK